jgi:acyl phosphate:glycerol-3-phosphate acyltransferase
MTAFVLSAAYLLGSVPSAYLAGRVLRGLDIRTRGDGNMGAGNAYRLLGWRAGLAVFASDFCKGMLAIALAKACRVSDGVVLWAGVMAVVGHNWPIFLNFRGGRGEAAAIGVLVALVGWPALICFLLAVALLPIAKSVTLISAVGFILLPFLDILFHRPPDLILYGMFLPALVGTTHFLRVHAPRLLRL